MIIIHTEVNEKVGLGNYYRCKSIYIELKKRYIPVVFFVKSTEAFVCENNINEINFILSEEELKSSITNQLIIGKSILLIDLPILTKNIKEFYKYIRETNIIISINDVGFKELNPNVYINSDAVLNHQSNCSDMFVGIDYQIIRNDLHMKRNNIHKKIVGIKEVMIMFGGSDPGRLTEKMIMELSDKPLTYNFNFILGKGFSSDRIDQLKTKTSESIHFFIEPNIPDILSSADVVLTMGGSASYEAMYLGKPVLAIEWEHMSKYVEYLNSEKLLKSLGNIDSTNFHSELESVLNNKKLLNSISYNGYSLVDGKGLKRIGDIIEKYMR